MADVSDLSFPVLCCNQGVVQVQLDANSLTTCGRAGLRNGWFNGLCIVDSNGIAYVVTKAKEIGFVGLLRGFRVLKSRRIRIAIQFKENPTKMTLEDLKGRILKRFSASPAQWGSIDIDALSRKVREAQSFEEVILLFR